MSSRIARWLLLGLAGCTSGGSNLYGVGDDLASTPDMAYADDLAPSCTDSVRNGDETDVDCGGSCGRCPIGRGCATALDCDATAVCDTRCRFPLSCAELAAKGLADGLYSVKPDKSGANPPLQVYCDLATAGGGWTLVGRSQPGGNMSAVACAYGEDTGSSFGWSSATGSPSDDTAPYSLDVAAHGLAFTEVLFGSYSSGKTWGANVFRVAVPVGYVAGYANTNLLLGDPVTVTGDCTGASAVMFRHVGYTSTSNGFHLRDIDGGRYGLYSSGWFSCYDDCRGGDVNGGPGMIFVR